MQKNVSRQLYAKNVVPLRRKTEYKHMISVEHLTVEFSARPLFNNVSFLVGDRDRIALVGKNGAGKSTLLKIISGQQLPTSGTVSMPQGCRVGYLPQVMVLSDDTTVRQEAQKAFADIRQMKQRVEQLQQQLAQRTDYETTEYMELVERFTQEHERYLMMGAEGYEAEMERTLAGLGFQRSDFDRPTSEFSGGWRMRIELAKILMQHPDVLLLDEPTNHLDIDSIQWLEQFLRQNACAVMLVSHDRAFINNVTSRTMEITCGQVVDYKVKYDEYLHLREERREQQLRAYENQQREIADIRQFVDRFRYQATKAVQVQQRLRQLEKIVPIEVDEVDRRRMHLKFPPCLRSGDYPVICKDVSKTYQVSGPQGAAMPVSHRVFSKVNLTVKRGEKVAFVGRNGEGKSTLVKCIMGQIPFDGELTVGHNVQIGYFAQNQAQLLDPSLTVRQTIDNVARGEIRLKINDLLGAFMFGGEAADKKVAVLSGGERSRLAMIRLLLEPVNLLILDEPTNHLDIPSKEVLKEAIRAFDGTAIIVSHDREFLDGLVSKVYAFADGQVREHLGGIYDYLSTVNSLQPPVGVGSKQPSMSRDRYERSDQPQATAKGGSAEAEYKERQKRMKKAERALEQTEKEIARIEERLKELDQLLMQPDKAADMVLVTEYTDLKRQQDETMERWEKQSEELELILATP